MSKSIKRAETIAVVDKAIDKLKLFREQICNESVTVEDISINQRLRSEADEVMGCFNMLVDIDYIVNSNPKNE